ncbi:PIG-L deacetylase family protein [Jongsikchunia kroppenstedtii]|uniref:PIG-L deacetylase family protein n=1 Tax=Jongsikchunia kroppenstedtii TaxID=1121721 RepID=UPI0003752E08|nr:PIG-L family deacetylase [Jongsikchunia kroppenstedtii]
MSDQLVAFPEDWHRALVLVAHPDDPEYGLAAAVAQWTAAGKRISYALASSGEAGIEGLAPDKAGPIREAEQRESARIVGVHEVEFWGYPDSRIRNTPKLRNEIADAIRWQAPDVVLTLYGGAEWAPGMPNQRDHMEFAAAVEQAYDSLDRKPRWLFCNGPEPTHAVAVKNRYVKQAVKSLAAHREYLSVLDPNKPVAEQAQEQVDRMTAARDDFDADHAVAFELLRRA